MKKFKLIKEYPGCNCKLGDIVEESNDYDRDNSHYKYPEYWEEVIEKDYEILSYIGTITNRIYKKDEKGLFIADNNWCLSEPVEKHTNINIYSIKRLSDGQVFTVGDKVNSEIFDKSCQIISNITIDYTTDSKIQIWVNNYNKSRFWYLEKVSKFKQPLFTTEDGVDIYEGDSFILLNTNTWWNVPDKGNKRHSNNYWSNNFKTFSTKETIEEYILMNKPCLSINDIINSTCFKFQTVVEELKTKVKSKIK